MTDREQLLRLADTLGIQDLDVGMMSTIHAGTLALSSAPPPAASPPLTPLPALDVAQNSAALELVEEIGRGGMGSVWLARERALDRDVAVKTLLHADDRSIASLLREARASGRLEHPNIVPVHALGADAAGQPLLVMKRVEGTTLQALIDEPENAAWPMLEERYGARMVAYAEILMAVSDALTFAHERGVVHRDIKPENIMIGPLGETYLLDWGVALDLNLGGPSEIVGTPAFMAPELARGATDEVGPATDVYLLGATLHTILTGEPRHQGANLMHVLLLAHESKAVDYGTETPSPLATLANMSTAANTAARPPSARAFRAALADYLRHRSSERLATESWERLRAIDADGPEGLRSEAASRALAEARFGFRQALTEWPTNEHASAGLGQALRLATRAEIARGNPDSAAAVLRELDKRDAELESEIEVLRRAVEEERGLAEAGRQAEVDADPAYQGRGRAIFGAAIGATIAGSVALVLVTGGGAPSAALLFSTDLAFLTVVLLGSALFRASLAANLFSRRVAISVLLCAVVGVMFSAIGFIADVPPVSQMPFRVLTYAAVFGMAAATVSRLLAAPTLIGFIGTLVAARWPALGLAAVAATVLSATSVLIWLSLWGRREQRAHGA